MKRLFSLIAITAAILIFSGCVDTELPSTDDAANVQEGIDLGLPSGLKWATCNIGAKSPEDYGDYFAWGETEPYYSRKKPFKWKEGKECGYELMSYRWSNGTDESMETSIIKYSTDSDFGLVVDNKTTLEPADDSASANWGGGWRMPTEDEWAELMTDCTWTWTKQRGVGGMLVTGPNGNSIFLPAAGYMRGKNISLTGWGYYWSSSVVIHYAPSANYVAFNYIGVDDYSERRWYGLSIRPVIGEGVISVTGISLDQDAIDLFEGESTSLTATVTPSNATHPTVVWSSSNTSVATVDNTGIVTAISAGTATITIRTYNGEITANCSVNVYKAGGTINGYPWVDLGLVSGLKWATCNVGANSPEDYGDYFAWGETEPYYSSLDPLTWKEGKENGYSLLSYRWCNVYKWLTKYNTRSPGIEDNKTALELEDDAARANWGGSWRMPTDAEWTELMDNCTWTWTVYNGVNGMLVTGPNGNSIFLPAARRWEETNFKEDPVSFGYYWSSSLYTDYPYRAWSLYFHSGGGKRFEHNRDSGLSVRPVSE